MTQRSHGNFLFETKKCSLSQHKASLVHPPEQRASAMRKGNTRGFLLTWPGNEMHHFQEYCIGQKCAHSPTPTRARRREPCDRVPSICWSAHQQTHWMPVVTQCSAVQQWLSAVSLILMWNGSPVESRPGTEAEARLVVFIPARQQGSSRSSSCDQKYREGGTFHLASWLPSGVYGSPPFGNKALYFQREAFFKDGFSLGQIAGKKKNSQSHNSQIRHMQDLNTLKLVNTVRLLWNYG